MNEQRVAVSDVERNQAAQRAVELFTRNALFIDSQHIACYLARTEEFDCTPIIQAIWAANKKCYLPVLSSEEGCLNFVLYRPNDSLKLNRYRILEPEQQEIFPVKKLDLVITPLVAFDLQGDRLGAGGGYYDKTFEFLKKEKQKKPCLIGLAYEFQCVHQLPRDEWDISINGVITEKQLLLT